MNRIIIFLLVVMMVVFVVLQIRQSRKSKNEVCEYDLIVEFKGIEDMSFMHDPQILDIYHYREFGKGYRGFSKLSDHDLANFFHDRFGISKDQMKVINATSFMNFIR